jgi:hypothetical protein
MTSYTYYPLGSLGDTKHPPIPRDQFCITLPPAAMEVNLPEMSCQRTDREQQPAGNSDYRRGRNAHIPKIDDANRPVADDLQDVRQRDHARFNPVETLTSASQSVDVMTARQYLARIRSFFTVAFGKPECLSASICAPPSYILLSDVLEITTNTRSLDSLAASDSDDTFYTVDE